MTTPDVDARGLVEFSARPRVPGDAPQSVAEILERPLEERPHREALADARVRYTYAALDAAVARAAGALEGLGITAGDRVAMSAPNSADLCVAFLATQRLGAVWVGINRALAAPEKTFILRDSGARLLLCDRDTAASIDARRADEAPELQRVVRVEPGDAGSEWAQLVSRAPARALVRDAIDPFAPAAMAYTSGTTGFPKGAVHSQHNLVLIGAVHRALGEVDGETRHGCILPLTILNLMTLQALAALQMGACAVCVDRTSGAELGAWIARERIGHFSGVPTILHDLLTRPDVRPEDLATLRRPLVGGSEVPGALVSLYKERFGSELLVGYGMTEAPTAVTMTDAQTPWRPGACGAPLPHVEIQIVGEDDRLLGSGEVGEICVAPRASGPWAGAYTPMLGYWNRPDATRAALRGGRLHSGDLGSLGEDGTLTFRGRMNDLIIRGGANVYPAEVERVLAEDTRVARCAVLGKPDARLGERVVAFVELTKGARATETELRARCEASLARYKSPEEIVFVDELPVNAMGKVKKGELKARIGLGSGSV